MVDVSTCVDLLVWATFINVFWVRDGGFNVYPLLYTGYYIARGLSLLTGGWCL